MLEIRQIFIVLAAAMLSFAIFTALPATACTSLCLIADDGTAVCGRSMEWGTFDLNSRVAIVPRGHEFSSDTPDGKKGLTWKTRYGAVALDMIGKDYFADGLNEKGLAVNYLYLPGFAEYQPYEPSKAHLSMGPAFMATYVLTQFATVDEVKRGMGKIRVVAIPEPALGGAPAPMHMMVTDSSGKVIVIEYLEGKLKVTDDPVRVLTNAPSFDWHLTNLRNYVNLSEKPYPAKRIGELTIEPLGGGSGLLGMPGDITPPSRFIRAAVQTMLARRTPDGPETVYEVFRIMDNFNHPLASGEGTVTELQKHDGMRSSTIWTSAMDTGNLVYYYHTQHNRKVRMIDLKRINFSSTKSGITHLPLDRVKEQEIEDITPQY